MLPTPTPTDDRRDLLTVIACREADQPGGGTSTTTCTSETPDHLDADGLTITRRTRLARWPSTSGSSGPRSATPAPHRVVGAVAGLRRPGAAGHTEPVEMIVARSTREATVAAVVGHPRRPGHAS